MKKETLEAANAINEKIKFAKDHKEKLERHLTYKEQRKTSHQQGLQSFVGNSEFFEFLHDFFPMPGEVLFPLYIAKLDAYIADLEKQLEAL